MATALVLLAVAVLGLSAGALLAEGAVLVPFWRSLAPDAFLRWYRQHGGLLLRFFGPLEVVAAASVIAATLASWMASRPALLLAVASLLALLVLAAFPLYFKAANESFAEGTLAPEEVPAELARWARWHWARVALATAAFAAALAAASGP